jgi:hypothetical protein
MYIKINDWVAAVFHTLDAIEITYAPSESLPSSAATRNVSKTSLTSGATCQKPN